MSGSQQVVGKPKRGVDGRIGQAREVPQGLGDVSALVQVPPDDTQEFPVAEQPEAVEKIVVA